MNYMEQAFENALQEQVAPLIANDAHFFKKGAYWAKMYYHLLNVAKQLHEKHPEMQAAKQDAYQKELESRFGTIAKPTVLSYSSHGKRVVVDIDHSGTTSDEVADLFLSLLGACSFGPTTLHESLYYKLKDYLEAFDDEHEESSDEGWEVKIRSDVPASYWYSKMPGAVFKVRKPRSSEVGSWNDLPNSPEDVVRLISPLGAYHSIHRSHCTDV